MDSSVLVGMVQKRMDIYMETLGPKTLAGLYLPPQKEREKSSLGGMQERLGG